MKSKKNLIIIIAVLAAAIIAAVSTITVVNVNNSPAKILSLAERYLDELNYEQAVIEFQRVIEVDPMNADAYEGLIAAYEALGDYDKAEETRLKALEITGDSRFEKVEVTAAVVTTTAAETTAAVETTTTLETTTTPKTVKIGEEEYSTDITELDLSYKQLTDISFLSSFTNLTSLNLEGNQISDISPP